VQGAVAGGLADVHVGHQQRAARWPVDGLVRQQPELSPQCSMGWSGIAVPLRRLSSSATIRAIRSASFSVLSVAHALHQQRKRQRPGRFNACRSSAGSHFQQLAMQPLDFQLLAQHLIPRLAQQQVAASCLRNTS
jgi:hypothetical protein